MNTSKTDIDHKKEDSTSTIDFVVDSNASKYRVIWFHLEAASDFVFLMTFSTSLATTISFALKTALPSDVQNSIDLPTSDFNGFILSVLLLISSLYSVKNKLLWMIINFMYFALMSAILVWSTYELYFGNKKSVIEIFSGKYRFQIITILLIFDAIFVTTSIISFMRIVRLIFIKIVSIARKIASLQESLKQRTYLWTSNRSSRSFRQPPDH